jgi:hypothetical protein
MAISHPRLLLKFTEANFQGDGPRSPGHPWPWTLANPTEKDNTKCALAGFG